MIFHDRNMRILGRKQPSSFQFVKREASVCSLVKSPCTILKIIVVLCAKLVVQFQLSCEQTLSKSHLLCGQLV